MLYVYNMSAFDFNDIANKISSGRFHDIRTNRNHYILTKKKYSFGERIIAIPKSYEVTEDLQASRGPQGTEEKLLRTKDISKIITKSKTYHTKDCEKRLNKLLKFKTLEHKTYAEIGFRSTDSLELCAKHFETIYGFDIIPLSIEIANNCGFITYQHNLSDPNQILQNAPFDVITAYHVLEHTHNPETCIKKIYEALKPGSLCALEIPISSGEPEINYGHLFPFSRGDLESLCKENGNWEILDKLSNDSIESYILKVL